MDNSYVLANEQDCTLWLELNRPERRNPLSSEMINALSQELESGYLNKSIRTIVIASSGPAFSAGHDLLEIQRKNHESEVDWHNRIGVLLDSCAKMMIGIVNAKKPVIACVQGIASAAGCQLVATCDLAIASTDAKFCTPGVNIGVFCTTPLVGVGRNLSRKHALEMALTGNYFDSITAERFGLINRHVPAEQLKRETQELAKTIGSRSSESIAIGKSTFYRQIETPIEEAFAIANKVMLENLVSQGEAKEGMQAFLQKRTPNWDTP